MRLIEELITRVRAPRSARAPLAIGSRIRRMSVSRPSACAIAAVVSSHRPLEIPATALTLDPRRDEALQFLSRRSSRPPIAGYRAGDLPRDDQRVAA
jgi:hypothetical protein